MNKKPFEEYYLHDHGDGNGWQVASKGPGKFGVITTHSTNLAEDGLIELILDRYIHGMLNSQDVENYYLTPEEARDIGTSLLDLANDGESRAVNRRNEVAFEH